MSIFSRLPPWRRALPWVLLVISVGFNIAFYLGQRWHERFLSDIEPAIAENAKLTPDQAAALKALRFRVLGEIMRTGKDGARRAGHIWDDLREAPVDRARIDERLKEMAEIRLQAQGRVIDDVALFLDSLAPDQRARTVEAIRRRDPITRTLLFGPGGLPRPPFQQGRPGGPPPAPPPEPKVAP
jgi:uncharacterized membrane protein